MPTQPGIIYRANRESSDSVFYQELMASMAEINQVRTAADEKPLGYRQVVTEGLGLPDSFTGKIKNGKYVPTREKLEALADYLGIRPETWDTYVRRYASDRLNDPMVVRLFRVLAGLSEPADSILLKGATEWAESLATKAQVPKAA
jgi:transcriptional regulator with XRE-family HTH domain